MFEYQCPECEHRIESPAKAKPGQKFRCSKCQSIFVPRAEAIGLADEDEPRPGKAAKRTAAKVAKPAKPATRPAADKPPKSASPKAAPAKAPADEDDNSQYGILEESEEEKKLAEKNKPKFGNVKDKFKRSARGPASALLVMPSNLLLGQGILTLLAGLALIVLGLWPLVFSDAPASDVEFAEQMFMIFSGIVCCCWGAIQAYGASQMQNLESPSWGLVASIFGMLPLFAGIFSLMALRDPRVIAGFEEPETGPIKSEIDEEDDEEDDEDDDDDDDEDEEEEEERPRKRKK